MNKLASHYETLNVAHTASLDEIRASYISLCKMFHTEPVMREELTRSYEILKAELEQVPSLPVMEMPVVAPRVLPQQIQVQQLQRQAKPRINFEEIMAFKNRQRESLKNQDGISAKIAAAIAAIAIVGVLALGLASPSKMMSRIEMLNMQDIFGNTGYTRPVNAPNGQAFPATSAYIDGYEIGNNTGKSSVLVSNSANENDVYLKLLQVNGNKLSTVRHVMIKGKSDFKMENLAPGRYEIQYLDLVAGIGGRSEQFSVSEQSTPLSSSSSAMSVKLKTADDGVLKVENVTLEEFNSLASI